MDPLRLYLLAGLVGHKAVWEVLKRRQGSAGAPPTHPRSISVVLMKGAKIAILLGLVVQTLLPDVLPITQPDTIGLRAVGLLLFTLGLTVAILGRVQLGDNWADIEAPQILRRQRVVDAGLYRYIRHPIYVGDLLLLLGFELALNSWLAVGVALMAPYVLWRAVREERMLIQSLPGYDVYCTQTSRFVPFLI